MNNFVRKYPDEPKTVEMIDLMSFSQANARHREKLLKEELEYLFMKI